MSKEKEKAHDKSKLINYEAIVVCPSFPNIKKWDVVCWFDNKDKCFESTHKKQSEAILQGEWQLENSQAKYLAIYNEHGQVIEIIQKEAENE